MDGELRSALNIKKISVFFAHKFFFFGVDLKLFEIVYNYPDHYDVRSYALSKSGGDKVSGYEIILN